MAIEMLGWLVLGLAAGGAAAFLVIRPRIRAAGESARKAAQPEGARNHLASRQRAIDELIKPLKKSLEKVDGRIREIAAPFAVM